MITVASCCQCFIDDIPLSTFHMAESKSLLEASNLSNRPLFEAPFSRSRLPFLSLSFLPFLLLSLLHSTYTFYRSTLFICTTLSSCGPGDQFYFEAPLCQRPRHPDNPHPPEKSMYLQQKATFLNAIVAFQYLSVVVTPGPCQISVNGVRSKFVSEIFQYLTAYCKSQGSLCSSIM